MITQHRLATSRAACLPADCTEVHSPFWIESRAYSPSPVLLPTLLYAAMQQVNIASRASQHVQQRFILLAPFSPTSMQPLHTCPAPLIHSHQQPRCLIACNSSSHASSPGDHNRSEPPPVSTSGGSGWLGSGGAGNTGHGSGGSGDSSSNSNGSSSEPPPRWKQYPRWLQVGRSNTSAQLQKH
jgi:hypothetical protein